MRQPHELMQPAKFPFDLQPRLGKRARAKATVTYRSIVTMPDKKTGKDVRFPLFEAVDISIDGYEKQIGNAVLISPAFWKSRAKVWDTIEFDCIIVREKNGGLGFRLIRNVQVFPYQTAILGGI